MSPSIVAEARLSADGSKRALTGTNLAPAEGSEVTVTVNGRASRVIESCSASVKGSGCRVDRLAVQAPEAKPETLEIRIRNGAHPEAAWQKSGGK